MMSTQRLIQRLSGAGAFAALLLVLNACGRADTAAPVVPQAVAPTSAPAVAAQADPTDLPTVVVAGAAAPEVPTIVVPQETAIPVPAGPALAPALSGGTVQVAADFAASSDLSAWKFGQIFDDETSSAPAWSVKDGKLVAPRNDNGMSTYNDTLALTTPAQGANYSFETNALARYNSMIGVVVGYTDANNYVAFLLADNSPPNGQPGLQLVQHVNGQTTVLAEQKNALLQAGRWYAFGVQVTGTQITATLDGKQVFNATANAPLGQQAGLYASFEGAAYFSAARLTVQ